VQAAAEALLNLRTDQLRLVRGETLAATRAQARQLGTAVNTVDQAVTTLREQRRTLQAGSALANLQLRRDDLVRQLRAVNTVEQQIATTPLASGRVVRAPYEQAARHVWAVPVASGAALGLLAGLLLAMLRGHRAPRVRRIERLSAATSLPVRRHRKTEPDGMRDHHPTAYLSLDDDPTTCQAAAELDAGLHHQWPPVSSRQGATADAPALSAGERVVLVASRRTRVGTIVQEQASLADLGLETVGVVLVDA